MTRLNQRISSPEESDKMSGTLTPINEMSRQPIVFSQRSVDDDDADEGRRSIVTCFPGTKAKSRKHDTTIAKQRMSWFEDFLR